MMRKNVEIHLNWRFGFVTLLFLLILSGCASKTPGATCPGSANSTASCDPITPVNPSTNTTQTAPAASNSTAIFSLSDLVPRISALELWQKITNNTDVLIIDTRVDVEILYASGHIKGAIPVPLSQFTEKKWVPTVALDKEIVLYCT
jgi:hypothetical protein